MKFLYFIFPLFLPLAMMAQNKVPPKWTADITITRQIQTSVNTTDKGKCDLITKEANDIISLSANMKSDLLFGQDFTNSVQLSSDQDEAAVLKNHPLSGGGSIGNSGEQHDVSLCTCDCGDCKIRSDTKSIYGGNGSLDMSKVSFSFDYDIVSKHGTFSLKLGFNLDGNSNVTIKDCHESKSSDASPAYKIGLEMFNLSYGSLQVQNFDPYQEAGFDAATLAKMHEVSESMGMGGLADIKMSDEGFEITYSFSKSVNHPVTPTSPTEDRSVGGTNTTTYTTTLHAFFKHKINKPELLLTISGYQNWLPEAGKDEKTVGNKLTINARLKNEDDSSTVVYTAKKMEFELIGTSRLPGICMNMPFKDPQSDFDLQFSPNNPGTVSGDKQTVTIVKDEFQETQVSINSFDWGGYTALHAKATLSDGKTVDGYVEVEGNKTTDILIPYRDKASNHTAKAWLKDKNAEGYDDNYDNEKQDGLGDHNGDGLSLYEEYRGFMENDKHIRTDPKKIDLMVCDMIEGRAKDGIDMFRSVTGIEVHDKFKLEEFGKECDAETEGLNHDKCVNFNNLAASHIVDQHGIALVQSMEKKGYAQAVLKDPKGAIGTPKRYKYLEITADFDPSPEGFNVVNGVINDANSATADPSGKAKIITDEYAVTVCHEMLHCCNVSHHGDKDFGDFVLFAGDHLPLGTDLKLVGGVANPSLIYAVQKAIAYYLVGDKNAYREDGSVIMPHHIPADGLATNVGVQQGQHSGVEDCIMRYDAANAYKGADGYFYLIMRKPGYYAEMTGITLCTSGKGTGVNASDHKPRPRYGDADNGRGNCKHQFCINDKYH